MIFFVEIDFARSVIQLGVVIIIALIENFTSFRYKKITFFEWGLFLFIFQAFNQKK